MPQHEWGHNLLSRQAYCLDCCLSLKSVRQMKSPNCSWGFVILPTMFGQMVTTCRHCGGFPSLYWQWIMHQVVSQHDYKTDSPHGNAGECSLWMGSQCFLESASCFRSDQPCWYLYKGDARWGPFWRLRDSFMCPLSDFLQQSLLDVHLLYQHNAPLPLQVIPSAASSAASFTRGSYLMALFSSSLSGTMTAISHLSSADRHIFRLLHRVVPSVLIWHWWMNPDYPKQVSVLAPFWLETVFCFGMAGTETVFCFGDFETAFCFGTSQNRFLFWRPCGPKQFSVLVWQAQKQFSVSAILKQLSVLAISTLVGSSFWLFVLDARMGGVPPVCPWSASCSLKIL